MRCFAVTRDLGVLVGQISWVEAATEKLGWAQNFHCGRDLQLGPRGVLGARRPRDDCNPAGGSAVPAARPLRSSSWSELGIESLTEHFPTVLRAGKEGWTSLREGVQIRKAWRREFCSPGARQHPPFHFKHLLICCCRLWRRRRTLERMSDGAGI